MNQDFQLIERLVRGSHGWRKQTGADEWQAAINQGRRQQNVDFSACVVILFGTAATAILIFVFLNQ